MYSITKVCTRCDNNRFIVRPQGAKFEIVCSKCRDISDVVQLENKMIVPKCGKCGSEIYRVQKENRDDNIKHYSFTCTQCEEPAEFILIDDDGNQITKEQKELLDIKKLIGGLIRKVEIFETSIDELRGSISDLDLQHEEVTNKVDTIYSEVSSMKSDMSSIESQLGDLNTSLSENK